ncbi:MAG TPA: DegT/DnrJ/EryC1/StrS family aminotransferase [Vicinamibacterales bacterium]|jgi:dTDP-4-amino-4,6-dideoxygalactose transaminase
MHTLNATQKIPFVDLKAQYRSIRVDIDAAIAAVIEKTAFVGGPFLKEFEDAFARYCGVNYCVGVANGTDALFVALKALGVGPGDEVITVANSFVATSEAIKMAGAQVVFVDIDPVTFTIDVTKIEEKITPKTKVILPVHLYGQPAQMQEIRDLARKHQLRVVGDAAQAHGAGYRGQPIAKLADITCFSFYPGKNLGAYGDAGALVTDNEEWAVNARMFANHGRVKKYDHDIEGVNSRLDGLQAAILNAKLPHLDQWTEARRVNAYKYNEALEGLPVETPRELDDVRAVYHLYVIRVPAADRDTLRDFLQASGVETGVHYPIALPYLNAYRHLNHSPADFPESLKASDEILSLPMFPELTDPQRTVVCDEIRRYFSSRRP